MKSFRENKTQKKNDILANAIANIDKLTTY